ncbi:MAG: C2 family cysteine protease [Polyangiaceae bacterium]|jgi:hypothetical protein
MDPIRSSTYIPPDSVRHGDPNDPLQPGAPAAGSSPQQGNSGVSGGAPGDDGCPAWIPAENYNFDEHVQATVVAPELFIRNTPSDIEEISPRDVSQNQIGDCALLATLCALANTSQGRAVLRNSIVENKDPQGHVVSYSVTLFERRPTTLGSVLRNANELSKELGEWAVDLFHTLSKVTVTVDGKYACGHADARATDSGTQEVWPLVLEKAVAQIVGGYDALNGGSLPHRPMEMLTGKPAAFHPLVGATLSRVVPGSFSPSDVASAVAAGRPVVLATKPALVPAAPPGQAPPYRLQAQHSYAAVGIVEAGGKKCLELMNPWGCNDPTPIPLDELPKYFLGASAGSVN